MNEAERAETLKLAQADDSAASQRLFEDITSPYHRVDTRTPADVAAGL